MSGKKILDLNALMYAKTAKIWEKFGAIKRAGVLMPVFSVYSEKSCGIGEISDINLIADFCVKSGLSIIQLLPMNDTGFDYAPYSAQSTFALDPMYLRLYEIQGVDISLFKKEIAKIKEKFPAGKKRVDYRIKEEKLRLLYEMFVKFDCNNPDYINYKKINSPWLNDYALYKAIKEMNSQKSWEEWPEELKLREFGALSEFEVKNIDTVEFYKFQQYQLFIQFSRVKKECNKKGIYIQGDLPFLVSRDSADVWAKQGYFKLNMVAGAPPDMYFAKGQRWGMPPYNWEIIEHHGYDYIKEKVRYAENFYDMFRIDHFVGLFRLWTINENEPHSTYGLNGRFDPENEDEWKNHGTKIIDTMLEASSMLPCAEDLGVVPQCSYETLDEYGIPGMDVQRWTRDWGKTYEFKNPSDYRVNASSIISSHDMSPLILWWEQEAGTVDALLVEKLCEENDIDHKKVLKAVFEASKPESKRLRFKKNFKEPEEVLEALELTRAEGWMFYDLFRESAFEKEQFLKFAGIFNKPENVTHKELTRAAIKASFESSSVFSVQLIQDYLGLGNYFEGYNMEETRINVPGTVSPLNWSFVLPVSLEKLAESEVCDEIKNLAVSAGRN